MGQTAYSPEKLPEELINHSWLNILGATRFIILLLDKTGRALWAVNQKNHDLSGFIAELMSAPVSKFYKMADLSDLNSVFSGKAGIAEKITASENHLDLMGKSDFTFGDFPSFLSRNLIEPSVFCPFFSINQPLTIISVLRINPDRFLGVVFSRPIRYRIELAERRNVLMADDKDRILGYSALFSRPLRLREPGELLGRPVSEVIQFNRPPLNPPGSLPAPDFKLLARWEAGKGDLPFRKVNWLDSRLETGKGSLDWRNDHPEEWSYLELEKPFPVDGHHACIEIEFSARGAKMPNLIFRGMPLQHHGTPDWAGYTFTNNNPGAARCRFKKNANDIKYLRLPEIPDQTHCCLKVVKIFDQYLFYLNDALFGHYVDVVPFQLRSGDLFYLFLRPGESLSFSSVRLGLCPYNASEQPVPPPLTATFMERTLDLQYNVSVEESALAGENCVTYQFNDITRYVDGIRQLESERDKLTDILQQKFLFVGQSSGIMEIKQSLKAIGDSHLTVLVEGETGSGKEVLARTLHQESARAGKPFIKIDCSTIPAELVESELFGHEKGSFTGATSSRIGLFEQAQGGTVFLDEVANLPLNFQPKLLGVLQDNEIHRVGGQRSIKLDFRLIAASNVPLRKMIEQGRFRADLYYRLNQYRFELPPLRSRVEDISLLAEHFLGEAKMIYKKEIRGFERDALEKLYRHSWPGNVRELRNTVLRAAVLCAGEKIAEKDVFIEKAEVPAPQIPVSAPVAQIQRRKRIREAELADALKKMDGHVTLAAASLGISRALIYRLLNRFKIDPKQYR